MAQKIVINGQAYDGPDAMPPDVREQYEAALRLAGSSGQAQTKIVQHNFIAMVNGKVVAAPSDLPPEARAELERLQSTGPAPGAHTTITINGTRYDSPDAMPADVRAQYDRAMAALSGSGPQGKLEAAAMRRLLRFGSPERESSGAWRIIGWLVIGALALYYAITHWRHV